MTKFTPLLDAVSGWTRTAAACADARPDTAEMLAIAALDLLSSVREDAARMRMEQDAHVITMAPLSMSATPGARVVYA